MQVDSPVCDGELTLYRSVPFLDTKTTERQGVSLPFLQARKPSVNVSAGRLKGPLPIQKVDQVPLVGLQPVELNGANRPQIEPIDVSGVQK